MPLVILQPCASTGALKHYKDTIEKTVKVSDIEDQISQQEIINLKLFLLFYIHNLNAIQVHITRMLLQ